MILREGFEIGLTESIAVFAVLRRVRMLLLCVFCLPANTCIQVLLLEPYREFYW